jgi:hypothetical protein
MIFYLILFGIVLLLSASSILIKKKFHVLLFWPIVFVLFLVAAFRGAGVDHDYDNYLEYYNTVVQNKYDWVLLEPAYYLISKISYFFLDNSYLVFIIYAFLGLTIKSQAIKETSNFIFLSLLLYFCNYFFLHEMTQIRVGVASGIFLYSIKFIEERNIKKFGLCILFATTFHYTSVIGIPFYFLNPKKLNVKIYYTAIIISIIMVFLQVSTIDLLFKVGGSLPIFQKLNMYKTLIDNGDVNKINFFNIFSISSLLFNSLFLWKAAYLETKNKYFILFLKISCFGFLASSVFFDFPVLSFRISEYLGVVNICLFPMLFYFLKEKYVSTTLIVMYVILVFVINIYYAKYMLPYKMI